MTIQQARDWFAETVREQKARLYNGCWWYVQGFGHGLMLSLPDCKATDRFDRQIGRVTRQLVRKYDRLN